MFIAFCRTKIRVVYLKDFKAIYVQHTNCEFIDFLLHGFVYRLQREAFIFIYLYLPDIQMKASTTKANKDQNQ